ncbi:MAG: ABC transporter ATP-binding protein [Euryarchaeota archaeon]|nr:ABC transporter ATP-binding protein [Euryarchaeota archaeon]MDE1837778.1 ABC transporter ATP-binding protein [Euryarchaeota archaeon]MDE2046624.1 ABC transporter ATP-binding protein [Thermoplasmata archaeon]
MVEDAISARDVRKVYRTRGQPPVEALSGVSIRVPKGSRISLLGRNGAGKTTFLRIASTLLLPTSGEVRVFGRDVVEDPEGVRPLIAVVPQEGKPFFHLTPREQVYTYLRSRGFVRETAKSRTEEALSLMSLGEVADRLNVTLSGGQRQRAMVATVISTQAPLLFLDEPTIGLDPFARRGVWETLRLLTRRGSTILLTTHYLDEADVLSDRLYIVDRGRVVGEGSSEELKRTSGGTLRVTFQAPFSDGSGLEGTLSTFGPVLKEDAGGSLTLFTGPERIQELMAIAMARKVPATVGPVTLEEAFLRLVGRSIDEEDSGGR